MRPFAVVACFIATVGSAACVRHWSRSEYAAWRVEQRKQLTQFTADSVCQTHPFVRRTLGRPEWRIYRDSATGVECAVGPAVGPVQIDGHLVCPGSERLDDFIATQNLQSRGLDSVRVVAESAKRCGSRYGHVVRITTRSTRQRASQ